MKPGLFLVGNVVNDTNKYMPNKCHSHWPTSPMPLTLPKSCLPFGRYICAHGTPWKCPACQQSPVHLTHAFHWQKRRSVWQLSTLSDPYFSNPSFTAVDSMKNIISQGENGSLAHWPISPVGCHVGNNEKSIALPDSVSKG